VKARYGVQSEGPIRSTTHATNNASQVAHLNASIVRGDGVKLNAVVQQYLHGEVIGRDIHEHVITPRQKQSREQIEAL
jgi:hypothetical protein